MESSNKNKNSKGLRKIKTGREIEAINNAAKAGFRPLIKKVEPSKEIRSKFSVVQNKKTGEIDVRGDVRIGLWGEEDKNLQTVIDWTFYYPHNFESPFAAYLIPHDIKIGERVYIEDLIEDYVGGSWNQGDNYRLESCEAIWNGNDLEIQYDPKLNRTYFMG